MDYLLRASPAAGAPPQLAGKPEPGTPGGVGLPTQISISPLPGMMAQAASHAATLSLSPSSTVVVAHTPPTSPRGGSDELLGMGDLHVHANIVPRFESSDKGRLVWTFELHGAFVAAVSALGIEKARPQSILRLMTGDGKYMDGLTSEHIKSHLQKYRHQMRSETHADSPAVPAVSALPMAPREPLMPSLPTPARPTTQRRRRAVKAAISKSPRPKPMIKTKSTPRLVWTEDLHACFVKAVDSIGIDRARPQTVQRLMAVPGLTTEHIKSHLQKYRYAHRAEKNGGAVTSRPRPPRPTVSAAPPRTSMALPVGSLSVVRPKVSSPVRFTSDFHAAPSDNTQPPVLPTPSCDPLSEKAAAECLLELRNLPAPPANLLQPIWEPSPPPVSSVAQIKRSPPPEPAEPALFPVGLQLGELMGCVPRPAPGRQQPLPSALPSTGAGALWGQATHPTTALPMSSMSCAQLPVIGATHTMWQPVQPAHHQSA